MPLCTSRWQKPAAAYQEKLYRILRRWFLSQPLYRIEKVGPLLSVFCVHFPHIALERPYGAHIALIFTHIAPILRSYCAHNPSYCAHMAILSGETVQNPLTAPCWSLPQPLYKMYSMYSEGIHWCTLMYTQRWFLLQPLYSIQSLSQQLRGTQLKGTRSTEYRSAESISAVQNTEGLREKVQRWAPVCLSVFCVHLPHIAPILLVFCFPAERYL